MPNSTSRRFRNARWPDLPLEEMKRLDARLARLGRGLGAMRLRVGEGLLHLDTAGGVKALGYPNIESYCREALGRTGRWGTDVRVLARRLAILPKCREAVVAGRLTTSMVELVARVATPLDEAEWVERAETMTVRAMRAELTRRRIETMDDTAPERVSIQATVNQLDAWAFERAKLMVEAVSGAKGEDAIEAMLAEGLTEILAQVPDFDLPSTLTPAGVELLRSERADDRALQDASEASLEALTPMEPASYEPEPEIEWPADPRQIDARLRLAAQDLAWRDLEMAVLGKRCEDHGLWLHFGYWSWDHYCRDRIGVAPNVMASRLALAKRMTGMAGIASALADGRIGFESAATIARVANPSTVDAWVERAATRTVKHLREEVAAVELIARAEGRLVNTCVPPDDETLEAVRELERSVLTEVSGGRMSGGGAEARQDDFAVDSCELPVTAVRLSLTEDMGRFWRALEGIHAGLGGGAETFVAFLARAVARSWAGVLDNDVAYAGIYRRDRWRCASPVCSSRNVTPHHVQFRAHGGSDLPGNIISLCERCHLELVHEGRLRVKGTAPHGLRWSALAWAA